MWAGQISTESYQIARIHIEEISLLAAAAFQEVSCPVVLFQVKVGFGQCECIQVLCIFLRLGQMDRQSQSHPKHLHQVNLITEKQINLGEKHRRSFHKVVTVWATSELIINSQFCSLHKICQQGAV